MVSKLRPLLDKIKKIQSKNKNIHTHYVVLKFTHVSNIVK